VTVVTRTTKVGLVLEKRSRIPEMDNTGLLIRRGQLPTVTRVRSNAIWTFLKKAYPEVPFDFVIPGEFHAPPQTAYDDLVTGSTGSTG
jgi:hypothetical protein